LSNERPENVPLLPPTAGGEITALQRRKVANNNAAKMPREPQECRPVGYVGTVEPSVRVPSAPVFARVR